MCISSPFSVDDGGGLQGYGPYLHKPRRGWSFWLAGLLCPEVRGPGMGRKQRGKSMGVAARERRGGGRGAGAGWAAVKGKQGKMRGRDPVGVGW